MGVVILISEFPPMSPLAAFILGATSGGCLACFLAGREFRELASLVDRLERLASEFKDQRDRLVAERDAEGERWKI
jgi:hypothetical protein